mmetsp:Transcript_11487/g.29430  ORF Transcript_11487/g.29430 Transcript_11487/m.29430 type:complete len:267 (-) Transcript_11487:108-908(-)
MMTRSPPGALPFLRRSNCLDTQDPIFQSSSPAGLPLPPAAASTPCFLFPQLAGTLTDNIAGMDCPGLSSIHWSTMLAFSPKLWFWPTLPGSAVFCDRCVFFRKFQVLLMSIHLLLSLTRRLWPAVPGSMLLLRKLLISVHRQDLPSGSGRCGRAVAMSSPECASNQPFNTSNFASGFSFGGTMSLSHFWSWAFSAADHFVERSQVTKSHGRASGCSGCQQLPGRAILAVVGMRLPALAPLFHLSTNAAILATLAWKVRRLFTVNPL